MERLNNNTIFLKGQNEGNLQMVTSDISLITIVNQYKKLESYMLILTSLKDTQDCIKKMDKKSDNFFELTGKDIKRIEI